MASSSDSDEWKIERSPFGVRRLSSNFDSSDSASPLTNCLPEESVVVLVVRGGDNNDEDEDEDGGGVGVGGGLDVGVGGVDDRSKCRSKSTRIRTMVAQLALVRGVGRRLTTVKRPLTFCKQRRCALTTAALVCLTLLTVGAFSLGRYGDRCPSESDRWSGNRSSLSSTLRFVYRQRSNAAGVRTRRPDSTKTPVIRLSRDVRPLHYDLHVDLTELHRRRVKGNVRILVECLRNVDWFLLHASGKHLTISSATLTGVGAGIGRRSLPDVVGLNQTVESSVVNVTARLTANVSYELHLVFLAAICDGTSGVNCFDDPSRHQSGQTVVYASTKFEPTGARTLIPCFDEPEFKTPFNVSLTRHTDLTVLTNGQLLKRVRMGSGYVVEYFETTPPMSTYLLGFVAGQYVRQESLTNRGVKVAVWTRREDRSRGSFARDYAVHMLQTMENYFTIAYPLPKMDLLAVPHYPVGAMENWGLLIFHQRTLLYSDEYRLMGEQTGYQQQHQQLQQHGNGGDGGDRYQTHLPSKFQTSKIVTHELVHQWFGNLVTMQWWSDVWLNEGFATFFIYHFLKTDFRRMVEFHQTWKLVDVWQRQSFWNYWPGRSESDAQWLSLVRNFSSTEEEIYDAFDEYHLYAKGGAIVDMLWNLLGEDSLRSGLIRYLESNAYRAVDRFELWRHLEMAAVSPVSGGHRRGLGDVMESWLTNPGFPEVNVERIYAVGESHIRLQQQPADVRQHCAYADQLQLRRQSGGDDDHRPFVWSIPVTFSAQMQPLSVSESGLSDRQFWLMNGSESLTNSQLTNGQWLLVNPDLQFPYRVNYDRKNWALLIAQLRTSPDQIPVKSRAQLIVDAAFFMRETDHLHVLLDLLGYLKKETELLPVILGLKEIFHLLDLYKSASFYPLLVFYFRPVVEQATDVRSLSTRDQELDAIWWMDDEFQSVLKVLQCVTRHRRCRISREEARGILSLPANGQLYEKLIPVCEFLRRNYTTNERQILLYWLQQGDRATMMANEPNFEDVFALISCAPDNAVLSDLIDLTLNRSDFELLRLIMSSTLTLNYNDALVVNVWTKLANVSGQAWQDEGTITQVIDMIKGIRSLSELALAKRSLSLPVFNEQLEFMTAKLTWQDSRSSAVEDWLLEKMELKVS